VDTEIDRQTRSSSCRFARCKLDANQSLLKYCDTALVDLGFLEAGDFGNPSERSESVCRQDLARGGAQNDIEIT